MQEKYFLQLIVQVILIFTSLSLTLQLWKTFTLDTSNFNIYPLALIIIQHSISTFSVGHKGKFGHEFLEFEFKGDGKLRYANDSQYRKDTLIRKEVTVNQIVLQELRKIIEDCEIMKYAIYQYTCLLRCREDDKLWPQPDREGRQELEIVLGNEHICFNVRDNICGHNILYIFYIL